MAEELVASEGLPPCTLHFVGRNRQRLQEIARRLLTATAHQHTIETTAHPLSLESNLLNLMSTTRPTVVVNAASYVSPYERTEVFPSGSPFAASLALQTPIAVRVAQAVRDTSPGTTLVNAAYPDVVNPVLASMGLPIRLGVGNVGTLAFGLQSHFPHRHLRMLGHHRHLSAAIAEEQDVIVHDGRTVHSMRDRGPVQDALRSLREQPRRHVNSLGAKSAARLIRSMLRQDLSFECVPGPNGLPGGYPVKVSPIGECVLDLPPGWNAESAVHWNLLQCQREGVSVRQDGVVRFQEPVLAWFARQEITVPERLNVDDLESLTRRMLTRPHATATSRLDRTGS